MVNAMPEQVDPYLERLKAARKGPAVLKLKLVILKSSAPDTLVFAFEGNDDKIVYFHWIRRIQPELSYEPFPCDGKSQVLDLKEIVDRDLSDISRGVYYFVDRDFDDLVGPTQPNEMFMTDSYAVENYLVSSTVLQELLKNELHCHAEIACRTQILQLFERVYSEYLEVTKPLNFRLFVARKLGIKLLTHLPDKANRLADIKIENVLQSEYDVTDLIKMEREPTEEETISLQDEFDRLDSQQRYRGKFAFLFFKKWLELLSEDRNKEQPSHFPKITNGSRVQYHHLNLDSFAAKSALPCGLNEFISNIA